MQKEEEIKKLKVEDFAIPISFVVIGLCLFSWYQVAENVFEKLIVLGIFIMFILPVYIKIYAFKLSKSLKPKVQFQVDNKGVITQRKNNSNPKVAKKEDIKYERKYETKEITSQKYIDLRNCIIASSKNKLFRRQDILEIKATINTLLGSHQFVYDGFTFENDLMEIYTKIKSSKMNDEKWEVLLQLINNINSKVEVAEDGTIQRNNL